jgi:hypothetical protein
MRNFHGMLHGETQFYVKASCFDGQKLLRLNVALTMLNTIPNHNPKTRKSWSQEKREIRLLNLYLNSEQPWNGFDGGEKPEIHPVTRVSFKIAFSKASIIKITGDGDVASSKFEWNSFSF